MWLEIAVTLMLAGMGFTALGAARKAPTWMFFGMLCFIGLYALLENVGVDRVETYTWVGNRQVIPGDNTDLNRTDFNVGYVNYKAADDSGIGMLSLISGVTAILLGVIAAALTSINVIQGRREI